MMNGAQISLRALGGSSRGSPRWLSAIAPALDRLLQIREIDRKYQASGLAGLPPLEFAAGALRTLRIDSRVVSGSIEQSIPRTGPVLIVSNHPFGGAEALVLAALLRTHRSDVKFLANAALGVFREFAPALIPTNPLRVSQSNLRSIRACEAQLRAGGVVVIFPAGKVSYFQSKRGRIVDGDWNRIVGYLAKRTDATLVPVRFLGTNSVLFHRAGRLWDRAKIFLLPREFLRLQGRRIELCVGSASPAAYWRSLNEELVTRQARLLTYLAAANGTAEGASRPLEPLAPRGDVADMTREIAQLPHAQCLLKFKDHSVHHARAAQIPTLMSEIARERERTFREHAEGSGACRDGDRYDESYVQLFVWDHARRALVGAYRMGRTDELRRSADPRAIYLSQMFEFDAAFYDQQPPALEMGRSFVVPEYQKSFHALYLLWQGIGRYVVAHPRYRRLYGTVSLSRRYADLALACLCDGLIEPSPHVRPRWPLPLPSHPEWLEYRAGRGRLDLTELSALVRSLDPQGKDVPVLLKHYARLGARFHCVGIDPNFSGTPGLLLSVDLARLEPKVLETFLGDGAARYLAWPDAESRRASR